MVRVSPRATRGWPPQAAVKAPLHGDIAPSDAVDDYELE
jgi:hypothetical protein